MTVPQSAHVTYAKDRCSERFIATHEKLRSEVYPTITRQDRHRKDSEEHGRGMK